MQIQWPRWPPWSQSNKQFAAPKPRQLRNTPSQAAEPRFSLARPSLLTLIQPSRGGCQTRIIHLGALLSCQGPLTQPRYHLDRNWQNNKYGLECMIVYISQRWQHIVKARTVPLHPKSNKKQSMQRSGAHPKLIFGAKMIKR